MFAAVHTHTLIILSFHPPPLPPRSVQVLARVLEHLLAKRGGRLTLLVGTSGDTGSSAIEAVRGSERLDLVVLYPAKGP